ncbi:MAG: YCF48-related protein [bacterium]
MTKLDKGTYNALQFVDGLNGWIIGSEGRILHTTDGGITWKPQNSGVLTRLHALSMLDDESGWITGDSATILWTTNGGLIWKKQNLPVANNRLIMDVSFSNPFTGWASTNYGEILHTTDGGDTWKQQQSGIPWAITGVKALSRSKCIAVATNRIVLVTSDEGMHWQQQKIDYPSPAIFDDVEFIDDQTGWISTNILASSMRETGTPLFRTDDGGKSWNLLAIIPTDWILSLVFLDHNAGWAIGSQRIFSTSNGGKDWSEQYQISGDTFLVDLSFIDRRNGWAFTSKGEILKYVH